MNLTNLTGPSSPATRLPIPMRKSLLRRRCGLFPASRAAVAPLQDSAAVAAVVEIAVLASPSLSSPLAGPPLHSSYVAQTQSSVDLCWSGGVAATGGSDSGAGTTTTTTISKFTLAQLSAATGGFRESNLVGEGGFGRVYRGRLDVAGGNLKVAVKQLCRGGAQGSREFLVECSMLMMLRHRVSRRRRHSMARQLVVTDCG